MRDLLEEAFLEISLAGEVRVHYLYGNVALQGNIMGFINRTHTTFSQKTNDLVAVQGLTD